VKREATKDEGRRTIDSKAQYAVRSTHYELSHVSRFTFHVSLRAHALAFIAFVPVALLLFGALVSLPPEGLTHHDTGAKYLQVRNLRFGTGGLDWSINYPARRLDPEREFVPFHPKQHVVDERKLIHLQWPIFLGLLTRVPWKVMGFWGLYLVPVLAGLGTLWAAYLLALRVGVPRRLAWVVMPLLGLATPISVYSLLFFEHTLASMLVTLSLLAAVIGFGAVATREAGADAPSGRATALSGALLAVAIYFRSELYVLAAVVGGAYIFLAWKHMMRRAALTWVAAFVIGLVPLWAFYAIAEGTLLPLHATWYFASSTGGSAGSGAALGGLPPLRYIASAGWGVVPDFLFGPRTAALSPALPAWAIVAGLVGVGLCALASLVRMARLRVGRVGLLLGGLLLILLSTAPTLLSTQPYYNLHGYLLASPFIALALWPGDTMWDDGVKVSPQAWLRVVTLLYVGLHVLIISSFSGLGPISRHEWGQRYLLPAYPALVVLSLLGAWRIWLACRDNLREKRLAVASLGVWAMLALVGLGFSARGYAVLNEERAQVVAWMHLARTLPAGEPLVTDVWWLPLNLAADFYTRPIMLAEGDARLAEWTIKMRERSVTSFGLMSNDTSTFEGGWHRSIAGLTAEGPPTEVRGMWLQRYTLSAIGNP